MLLPKLAVQAGVAGGQELRCGETQAGGGTIDPILRAFYLQVDADRSFIDRDEPGLAGGAKLSAELFVTEDWLVPEAVKYQGEGAGIGHLEFDFLAALVAVARGGTFIGDHGALGPFRRSGLAQAQDPVGLSKRGGGEVEELVGFEGARNGNRIAVAFDERPRFLGGAVPAQLDFSFGHLCSDDTMRQRARSSAG